MVDRVSKIFEIQDRQQDKDTTQLESKKIPEIPFSEILDQEMRERNYERVDLKW